MDDDDFDIEDLLQSLDQPDTSKAKPGATKLEGKPEKDAQMKSIQTPASQTGVAGGGNTSGFSDTKKSEATNNTSTNRSVRFSDTSTAPTITTPAQMARKQSPPQTSNLLTGLFGDKTDELSKNTNLQSKPPTGKPVQPTQQFAGSSNPQSNKPPISSSSIQKSVKPSASADDWLGLGDASPIPSPPPQQKNPSQLKQERARNDVNSNGEGDEDDLFKSLGLSLRASTKKPGVTESNPKIGSSRPNKPDNISVRAPSPPPPGSSVEFAFGSQIKSSAEPANFNFSPTIPSSLNPKSGSPQVLSLTETDQGAIVTNRNPLPLPKLPPQQAQPARSVLDSLPFLNTKKTAINAPKKQIQQQYQQQQQHIVEAGAGDGESGFSGVGTQEGETASLQKRKGPGGKMTLSSVSVNTLQLPSHLVDEEELKSMGSSLKALYGNQLNMLEKSYQEQIDFISQSSRRKEDLLREEMKTMQRDYDFRMERLKNELQETETRLPQRLQQELNTMANMSLQQFSTQSNNNINNATAVNQSQNNVGSGNTNQDGFTNANLSLTTLVEEIDKAMDTKLALFTQNLEYSLAQNIKPQSQTSSDNSKKLEVISNKLDALVKVKNDDVKKMYIKFKDSDARLQSHISKLMREQKKMKEGIIKSAVNSVTQTLQSNTEGNVHKDKMSTQIKEFRKELRRLVFELDVKSDSMHKSQLSIESEQKSISQTIRDLNTFLHMSSSRHNNNNNNGVNQIATMEAFQQKSQNEMEIRILREERNSLSESIAQMQVERRKINEERISLERDKMEWEREKNRLRDLEGNLKVKIAEAEDMKKQAEAVRKEESQRATEAVTKIREVEKQRSDVKEQFYMVEQKLHKREQKLLDDKTELIREKEFLDKLRDQLLCPGCLNSTTNQPMPITSSNISSTFRSAGDGLELSSMPQLNFSAANQIRIDDPYFDKESKFLDKLYYDQFLNI